MDESEAEENLRSLRNIRRYLTVAFLAVEQLCRKVASFPPARHLCSLSTDALGKIRDEVATIETRIMRGERLHAHLPDQIPRHPSDP